MKRLALALLLISTHVAAAASPGQLDRCDRLYADVVVEGAVDYGKVAAHPDKEACLRAIAEASPPTLTAASTKAERAAVIAFWSDAYNLLSILAISEDPQRWSPQQDGKILFRDRLFTVAGQKMSLDTLEHGHLTNAGDPRVEFLLSCGSRSCALLPGKLLSASNGGKNDGLEASIREGMRRWFARPENLRVNPKAGSVEVGQLLQLDWHGKDFESAGTPVRELIAKALEERAGPGDAVAAANLRAGRLTLTIRPYDWRLNKQRRLFVLP